MSETANFKPRLNTTPMRDLVRGRITGRLDSKGVIGSCGLPDAASQCVRRVVKVTGLWRIEKFQVAH